VRESLSGRYAATVPANAAKGYAGMFSYLPASGSAGHMTFGKWEKTINVVFSVSYLIC